MIDLDENKLDKVDGILSKFKGVLRKHWGLIMLLIFGYLCYWFFGLVNEEIKNPSPADEQYYDEQYYDD